MACSGITVSTALIKEKLMTVEAEAPLLVKVPPTGVLELSNMDHLFSHYNSVVLFYPPAQDPNKTSTENVTFVLRTALEALLLAHYPWVAGRLRANTKEGRLEVECNGDGVQYVAAKADVEFAELGDVSSPEPAFDLLYAGLQDEVMGGDMGNRPLAALQVTTFKCGGFALSIKSSHGVMDGYGAAVFLQNLCSIARGAGLVTPPDTTNRREKMKPRNPPSPTIDLPYIKKKTSQNKRPPTIGTATKFTFSAEALEHLRHQALHNQFANGPTRCSRFVAFAAHVWRAKAKSLLGAQHEDISLSVVVNLREKIVPALSATYVGNAISVATSSATVQELCEKPLAFAVHVIQRCMAGVTEELVQSHTDLIEILGAGSLTIEGAAGRSLVIPSMVGLPFYDTDCGWGRPLYCASSSNQPMDHLIVLDGIGGDGGSWNLLAVFESDAERLLFEKAIKV